MRRGQGYASPLGISVNGNRVNFAIHVPKEKKCELRLYKKGDKEPDQIYKMPEKDAIGTVRFLEVSDFDFEDYEYDFYMDEVPFVEPYARELTGRKIFGEEVENHTNPIHARIAAGPYEWNGDHPLNIPYHEVVAYSLHVRGFTKHRSSKVKHKGTFAGVAEKIPYLKRLGINLELIRFNACQSMNLKIGRRIIRIIGDMEAGFISHPKNRMLPEIQRRMN